MDMIAPLTRKIEIRDQMKRWHGQCFI